MATIGRFVWHELLTTDVEAAKTFYTEVIGWNTQQAEAPAGYTMWRVGERPIGGLMALPEQAKAHGAPPHWMGYVEVADVEASAKQVAELGGTVLMPVHEISEGCFAVIRDAQGAVMALYTPKAPAAAAAPEPGDITWNELNTTDYETAWTYYSKLFGWQETERMDMGPEMGTYFMFKWDGACQSMGGMSNAAKTMGIPTHWLHYISVADMDAAVERVKANGGKVINGPMEVPGGSRVAQCEDPQGAAFALHQGGPE